MKSKENERPAGPAEENRRAGLPGPAAGGLILYRDRVEHRQKLRRLRKHRRLALVAVLFAAILIYLNWDILSPTALGGAVGDFFDQMGKSKYPVTLSQGNFVSSVGMGGNLGVLTDTAFFIYSPSGTQYAERPHGMTTPAAQSAGGWAILYDRGGRQFKLESRFRENYSGQAENAIISACVSQSGSFAVVTESERYLSEVWVYDRGGKVLFRYYAVEGRVLSASLSPDGRELAVDLISAKNGDIASTVKLYRTDSRKLVAQKEYDSLLLYNVSFRTDNALACVGDSAAVFLDRNGGQASRYAYGDRELKCYAGSADATVLVFSKYGVGSESTVVSLGPAGALGGKADVSADIRSVSAGTQRIAALAQKEIWSSSLSCGDVRTYPVSGNVLGAAAVRGDVYISGLQTVYQYR